MVIDAGLASIVVAVIGALLTGYFSYRAAWREASIRLFSMMDETTAKERMAAYKIAWRQMKLLPLYPPTPGVTYGAVKLLNEQFRDWYFHNGGIYLTQESKDRYLRAQKQLYNIWKNKTDEAALQGILSDDEYASAREKLSDLRDEFAEDLRSRLPPGASVENGK